MAGSVALAGEADVIDGILNLVGDVGEGLGRGLTADVGRGGDDSLLEAVAELLRERLGGDAESYTTVLCQEIGSEIDSLVENDCSGLGSKVDDVPRHIGDVADIALQASRTIDQADEGFAVLALFDFKDLLDGLGVGGIAANAPDGVGGVQNGAALSQHFDGRADILLAQLLAIGFLNHCAAKVQLLS